MAYQFKVTLNDIQPSIWRRFQIHKTASLTQLALAIQDSMQYYGICIYRYIIEGSMFLPDINEDESLTMLQNMGIDNILGFQVEFEYHIGDGSGEGWIHTLEFEGEIQNNLSYPICIDGERACPPEDLYKLKNGYEDFIKIVRDLNHPKRKQVLYDNFLPEDFDPEIFDIKTVKYRKVGISGTPLEYF